MKAGDDLRKEMLAMQVNSSSTTILAIKQFSYTNAADRVLPESFPVGGARHLSAALPDREHRARLRSRRIHRKRTG